MNLEEKIIHIVRENIEKEIEVKLESKLREELDIDSMGKIILLNAIEDEFNLEIEDTAFQDIKTVLDIVQKLRENYPHIEEC